MSTDNEIIDAIYAIKDDMLGYDENNRGRAIMSRPLPDAIDVHRFLDTSRSLADAHAHSLAAGNRDWHLGTPAEYLLYRMPGIYGDNFSREYMDKRGLLAEVYHVVDKHTDETLWVATIIADTIARLDPVKDAAEIEGLVVMEDYLRENAAMLTVRLLQARGDKKSLAALRETVKARLAESDAANSDTAADAAA